MNINNATSYKKCYFFFSCQREILMRFIDQEKTYIKIIIKYVFKWKDTNTDLQDRMEQI